MKKTRIGIDARLYFQTGVGTYLRNLLSYLPAALGSEIDLYVYVLPEDVASLKLPSQCTIRPVDARWHSISEQLVFYRALMKDELDLTHFTYFSYPFLYSRPFIATIHDLTPLLFKTGRASTHSSLFYEIKHRVFKFILMKQILNAQRIITPTATVKKQITEFYGAQLLSKIMPIYEGMNKELVEASRDTDSNKLLPGLSPEYLLYVGNFYPHKNVERLIMAYKLLQMEEKPPLVLAGPDNVFARALKKSIASSGITGIQFIHDTSHTELISLYKHARALVNPSLSEGFGLPLVEAAYVRCPVIASDIPVFHELLGDLYTKFDPTAVEDIVRALQTPIEKLKTASIPAEFSFKVMTEKTAMLYHDVLSDLS